MRQRSLVNLVAAVVIAGAVGTSTPAQAQRFCNGFGFGNGGYAAGYSMAVGRRWGLGYGGGYGCLPRVSCWRP